MPYKDPQKAKENKKLYNQANRERIKENNKKRYEKTKQDPVAMERRRALSRENQAKHRKNNKDKFNERARNQQRKARAKNKNSQEYIEKERLRQKKYHDRVMSCPILAEKKRRKEAERTKNRRETDKEFSRILIFRAANYALRKKHRIDKKFSLSEKGKNKHQAAFGCSFEFLNAWLELQFRDGMTWENQGSLWELDHVIPLSYFQGKEENLLRLWNFVNLQPLLAGENSAKKDRLIKKYITYDIFHKFKDLLPADYQEPNFGAEWEMAVLDPI